MRQVAKTNDKSDHWGLIGVSYFRLCYSLDIERFDSVKPTSGLVHSLLALIPEKSIQ